MKTVKELRKLIEQYRQRLDKGGSAAMVQFIIEKIEETERRLHQEER
jgi:hypothetical protein